MHEDYNVEDSSIETPMFIGSSIMPNEICDDLISYFDKNERIATPGMSYNLIKGKKFLGNNDFSY